MVIPRWRIWDDVHSEWFLTMFVGIWLTSISIHDITEPSVFEMVWSQMSTESHHRSRNDTIAKKCCFAQGSLNFQTIHLICCNGHLKQWMSHPQNWGKIDITSHVCWSTASLWLPSSPELRHALLEAANLATRWFSPRSHRPCARDSRARPRLRRFGIWWCKTQGPG